MPQITAAPHPIVIGDETFLMSPLNDKDVDEINNWLRASYIQMARDSLLPSMSEKERAELLGVAMDRARKVSFIEGPGAELVSNLEGFIRVLYQGIKRNHKDLKFDAFKTKVFELKNADPNALANDVDAASVVFKDINVGKETSTSEKKMVEPQAT